MVQLVGMVSWSGWSGWSGGLGEGFTKKSSCSFGFFPNEGGGGPCPNFLSHFEEVHFWSLKGSISSKMSLILYF